jgi:hypothetical protein
VKLCQEVGCGRPHRARGKCLQHYDIARRNGSLIDAPRIAEKVPFETRLQESAANRDQHECWPWTGTIDRDGYGRTSRPRGLAHRTAYLMIKGPIPDGLEIDHLCRNRECVNPDHLEPVTHAENMRRAAPSSGSAVLVGRRVVKPPPRAPHCKQGHEYTPENTYVYRGSRNCRACNRAAAARYAQKAAAR